MKVGDLVRHRHSESGILGIITKRGYGKVWIAWLCGRSHWCVLSMLEVVSEGR